MVTNMENSIYYTAVFALSYDNYLERERSDRGTTTDASSIRSIASSNRSGGWAPTNVPAAPESESKTANVGVLATRFDEEGALHALLTSGCASCGARLLGFPEFAGVLTLLPYGGTSCSSAGSPSWGERDIPSGVRSRQERTDERSNWSRRTTRGRWTPRNPARVRYETPRVATNNS